MKTVEFAFEINWPLITPQKLYFSELWQMAVQNNLITYFLGNRTAEYAQEEKLLTWKTFKNCVSKYELLKLLADAQSKKLCVFSKRKS